MKLLSISARGLKGDDFQYDLGPFTAIIGPNFSGKTRITDAIRLLFMGYLPEVGKKASATFELATGEAMTIVGTFDDGEWKDIRLWSERGVIKIQRGYGSSVGLKDDSKAELEAIPLIDAGAYFEMTESQRVAYVFSAVQLPERFTREAIISDLHNVSFAEEHTEQIEKAKAQFIAYLQKGEAPQLQNWLDDSVVKLRTEFTTWNARQKDTVGAVRVMAELKARESEASAERIADLDAQLAERRTKLEQVNQHLGELAEAGRAWDQRQSRIRDIDLVLSRPLPVVSFTISSSEMSLLEAIVAKAPNEEERKLRSGPATIAYREAMKDLEGYDKIIRDATAEFAKVQALEFCPFCKSKGRYWKQELEEFYEQQIIQAKAKAQPLRDSATDLKKAMDEVVAKCEAIDRRATAAEQAEAALAKHRRHIALETEQVRNEEQRRALLKEELSRIENDVTRPSSLANELEKSRLLNEGAELRRKRDTAATLQQDIQRAAQAKIEHLEALANMQVVKAFQDVIAAKREAMVAEVFGSVLDTANMLCGEILPSPLAFHEGTVGRWSGAKFITHRTMSGTEKALTYIGIATALSARAPIKLVILDEIGRLDHGNQYEVIMALADMIERKKIDQAIVVGTGLQLAGIESCLSIIRTDTNL